jgi:hypothetical protein
LDKRSFYSLVPTCWFRRATGVSEIVNWSPESQPIFSLSAFLCGSFSGVSWPVIWASAISAANIVLLSIKNNYKKSIYIKYLLLSDALIICLLDRFYWIIYVEKNKYCWFIYHCFFSLFNRGHSLREYRLGIFSTSVIAR